MSDLRFLSMCRLISQRKVFENNYILKFCKWLLNIKMGTNMLSLYMYVECLSYAQQPAAFVIKLLHILTPNRTQFTIKIYFPIS